MNGNFTDKKILILIKSSHLSFAIQTLQQRDSPLKILFTKI